MMMAFKTEVLIGLGVFRQSLSVRTDNPELPPNIRIKNTSYWVDVSQTATNFLKPFNLNTPNEFMKIEKISLEI